MTDVPYPSVHVPYDEVTSSFIRREIRTGGFGDPAHRTYVNYLVYVEWYATDGLSPNATGLSAASAAMSNWRIAAKHPEAYDAVRRDCGATTRAETEFGGGTARDPDDRRRRARRHREQWRAVREGRPPDAAVVDEDDSTGRTRIWEFRFPAIPYHELESEFVRAELRRGSFDDLEHRRRVNRLVALEAWVRNGYRISDSTYPDARRWMLAAKEPTACDAVHSEFGRQTRADLVPTTARQPDDEQQRRHARQWRRVQEGASDGGERR